MQTLCLVAVLLTLGGCGRYFPGPLKPTAEQAARMSVNDDGSVTYTQDRLDVILKPVTDAQRSEEHTSELQSH